MGKIQAVRIRCDELELATLKSSGGGVLTLVGVDFQYLRLFTNQVKPFRRPFQVRVCSFGGRRVDFGVARVVY